MREDLHPFYERIIGTHYRDSSVRTQATARRFYVTLPDPEKLTPAVIEKRLDGFVWCVALVKFKMVEGCMFITEIMIQLTIPWRIWFVFVTNVMVHCIMQKSQDD